MSVFKTDGTTQIFLQRTSAVTVTCHMRQASFEDANGPDYKVLGEGEPQDSLGRPQSLLNPIWSQVTAAMPEKASKVSSVFNLTNTILGSGVIGGSCARRWEGSAALLSRFLVDAIPHPHHPTHTRHYISRAPRAPKSPQRCYAPLSPSPPAC